MPNERSPIWLEPGDAQAASLLAVRVAEASRRLSAADRRILRTRDAAGLIACLGGNSRYLADLAVRELDVMAALLRDGPDRVVADALATLDGIDRSSARPAIAAALRSAKRRVALAAAIADLGGLWILEEVTGALSRLAGLALSVAVEHLLGEARRAGRLRDRDTRFGRAAGLAVIGMGKLGAGELNYSSDVDLLLLYEPDAVAEGAAASVFSRIARDLVALMQARDENGYVFRVDLRLRPDPEATPPALSSDAALTYYEGQGVTWERAALSKARAVAGDIGLGERFLAALSPFVWRRHLDFAAIADMREMKGRIDRRQASLGAPTLSSAGGLLGHDLKLGEGGIREIEFVAQTLQLVWGGREPDLRARATLPALGGLASSGRLPEADASVLARAYRALRQAEHRLQMVADRQTHALPDDQAGFERFARLMGERDGEALSGRLLSLLLPVHRIFANMFAGAGDGWDAALAFLPSSGFAHEGARALVGSWRAGAPRALRHERARALFGELLPGLLAALGRQRDPAAALARFAGLLDRLPAGIQTFSLLSRHPPLVERIADMLGASPLLADHLAAVPAALEGLLAADEIDGEPGRTLARELAGTRDGDMVEVAIETTRRFVRGEEFRLALAQLEGRLDADRSGIARTALADAAITVLLRRVAGAHVARFGRVAGGGLAVVALGKAGSREMMGGSDLDLMMVYAAPDGAQSEGHSARSLPASVFFGRLSQALVAAVTARGIDGALYDVDMRLRPSGRQGPVAVSLASFRDYHRRSAWTWERMALTRARLVAGPAWLRTRVAAAIGEALDGAGPTERTRADATAMRRRLLRDKPPEGGWDVKMRAGGLIEVEFIAQVLQLDPALPSGRRHPVTRTALRRLASAGLLSSSDAAGLVEADRLWRTIQSSLRLMLGTAVPQALPERTRETIASALGIAPESIDRHVDGVASFVRERFDGIVGRLEPGGD